MNIRKATTEDIEQITQNNINLAQESEHKKISYQQTKNGITSLITDPNKGFYLVIEHDNTIIAQLMITYEWSDWTNKNIWWLQSLYIKPEHRRQGYFNTLLAEIKKRAQQNHVSTLKLYVHKNNTNAVEAYQHLKMEKKPYDIYQLQLNKKNKTLKKKI